jgi:hypothetical protein
LSVYPSVWRDSECEAHFIVLRDRINMLGPVRDDQWVDDEVENEKGLEEQTLSLLSSSWDQSYEEISASITGSIPWDVLRCCRGLSRKGLAIEGHGANIGKFRKAS